MARSRLLRLLTPLLLVAACGGGRSGTGISESVEGLVASQPGVSEPAAAAVASVVSTIQGNIAQLRVALHRPARRPQWLASLVHLLPHVASAHAAPALDGIRVSVDGFDSAVETGGDGSFVLNGDFAGPSVVRFEREEDGLDAAMTVNVPKGGVLTLRDLSLGSGDPVAAPVSQGLSFDGVIADKDCLERRVTMASRFAPQGERFAIALDDTAVNDPSGKRLYCIELKPGDDAHVEGVVRPDGAIGDGNVIVDGKDRMRETMTVAPQLARAVPQDGLPRLPAPPRLP